MPISKLWTKDLKLDEDKERFKESLVQSKHVFKVLNQIIDNFIEQNDKDRLKKDVYSRPNWALEQADLVGETRAYKKVLELLKNSLT